MYAKKTSPLVWIIPLAVVLVLAAALVILWTQFVIVGFKLYPKNSEMLDFRGQPFTAAQYAQLAEKLPECEILWDVPFQGKIYPSDTSSLTVTALTEEDLAVLDSFPKLKALDATGCSDYAQILKAKERPGLVVSYQVNISGQVYAPEAESIEVTAVTPEEVPLLDYLENLRSITVTGGEGAGLPQLQEYCHSRGISFSITIAGKAVAEDVKELTVEGITDAELMLLPLLPELKTLELKNPKATPEHVFSLSKAYPDVDTSWMVSLGKVELDSDEKSVDLSGEKLTSIEAVEEALSYLPELETVFLGIQDKLKNEDVAAFRERSRESYKVVWEVRFGDKKTLRTDITYFMPGRDWARGPSFGDDISYNLRYCEDLICVDVGHLGAVKHVDWLEGLVNLEYLILAHTDIRSLEGIQNCKKLKFLELDWTGIKDLTPLKECTALEDLNIGMAYPNVEPLLEMPWLKNVYMIFGSARDAYKISQACPDTRVVVNGNATVGSGWRKLPNYYAMRDALHAPYMHG